MQSESLPNIHRGFDDPVAQAQATFRRVLEAMARPATVFAAAAVAEAPAPLLATTAAVLLALADLETNVWLDPAASAAPGVAYFIRFHTGARIVEDRSAADFAVLTDPLLLPPLASFALGSAEYPDRSTTLLIQVADFGQHGLLLCGPGISGVREFGFSPCPVGFDTALADNHALFPRGVDLVFLSPTAVAALPRSTRLANGAPPCT